jgi:hypothetical protein
MGTLLGISGGLALAIVWLALLVLAFGWPLATWWAARSLSGIRRELERMNDHLEKRAFIEAPPREYTKMGTLVTR